MARAKPQEQPVEVGDPLPILTLRNTVLFPGAILNIDVGRPRSLRLIEDTVATGRALIGVLTQRRAIIENPGPGDLYSIGCTSRILRIIEQARGKLVVILQGVSRFSV